MTERVNEETGEVTLDYIQKLRDLSTTKSKGWQQSDCPVVRTSTIETGKAWKSVLAETKEDEVKLYNKCESAIYAQARYRRDARQSMQHVAQPKMLSAWIRAGRWEDQIESHSELKEKAVASACSEPGCNNPSHGTRYTKCAEHLDIIENPGCATINDLRNKLRSKGLTKRSGESIRDYSMRCREYLKSVNPKIAKKLNA